MAPTMAAPGDAGDVYATLLLNDSYLPGAVVLAHSLRDAGTTKKLAILYDKENVSVNALTELHKLYDFLLPIDRITNPNMANLYLMDRADLHSAFTKIILWKMVQFRRIVYIDADMVALRAPDELFDLPHAFAAAPDIGWPDLFNSGLMVLTPNLGEYYALLALAEHGASFDGADQGLLNLHFENNWHRIPFTYNVTPSAHYQYMPAFRHFQSQITMAHFIGRDKPWYQGREASSSGVGPYNELVGRWWSVYDQHYRAATPPESGHRQPQANDVVRQHVRGEWVPPRFAFTITAAPADFPGSTQEEQPVEPKYQDTVNSQAENFETHKYNQGQGGVQQGHHTTESQLDNKDAQHAPPSDYSEPTSAPTHPAAEPPVFVAPQTTWDPAKEPPPTNSKPEAQNFPSGNYSVSSDVKPFRAPEKYPEPPKDMWYEVPKTPTHPHQPPPPIFPFETYGIKPTRVFPEDYASESILSSPTTSPETVILASPDTTITTVTEESSTAVETPRSPTGPMSPSHAASLHNSSESWQSSTRGNAWDSHPGIVSYMEKMFPQKPQLNSTSTGQKKRRASLKLNDFPTAVERPSLPVTPAPVRRSVLWGQERDENLPPAEGVPLQSEWDPSAQLEKLAQAHSLAIQHSLGEGTAALPLRSVPPSSLESERSERVLYYLMSRRPPLSGGASPHGLEALVDLQHLPTIPDFAPLSAIATSTSASSLTNFSLNKGTGSDDTSTTTVGTATQTTDVPAINIEEPSFRGPSAQFERGESYLISEDRPFEPTDEDKDILET